MANAITRAFSRTINRIAYGEQDPYAPLRHDSASVTATGWWPGATGLDTSRVDYQRARRLYRNQIPQYKLGAHFSRPIINYTAGYMGVPHFKSKAGVPEADQALADFDERFVSKFLTVNRNMLRDGDVFVRLDYVPDKLNNNQRRFDIRFEHPDWVTPILDPLTGEWEALSIQHPVYPTNRPDSQAKPSYIITEVIAPETITISVDERAPIEIRNKYPGEPVPNPWGFIPVTHYRNEPEENQLFGVSDLEPLEPLFRAYHDTLYVGNQGIRLFAKPKVKFVLKDVNRFLADNFPGWRPGQPVNFQGHEIFLMTEGEDANYITAEPGTAGVGTLLEYLFFCILQTAQVPEFVLGTAVASSKASVDSQMGPFVKTIERKRMMSSEPYVNTHEMFLAMASKAPGFQMPQLSTYEVEAAWPEIQAKDEGQIAQTLLNLFQAFQVGTSSGLVSLDAANEFLRDFVPTLLPWLDSSGTEDERRRVLSSMAWLERIQSGGLPFNGVDITPQDQGAGGPGQIAA